MAVACREGHELETVKWGSRTRRVCRLCRREYSREYQRARAQTEEGRHLQQEAVRAYRARDPKRTLQQARKSNKRQALKKAGMTEIQYEQLLEIQGGGCAICGRNGFRRRLNIDHDHRTGKVRGLLCSGCNGATLGSLNDDPARMIALAEKYQADADRLRRAASYLENPPGEEVVIPWPES